MTNSNKDLSRFYNVKDEFCWEEEKPGDRKNENKPIKSYETVKEGVYQDEEEEKRIRVCSRENFIEAKRIYNDCGWQNIFG